MAVDDSKLQAPPQDLRINVNEPWQLKYCSTGLRLGVEDLRAAVAQVDPLIRQVGSSWGADRPAGGGPPSRPFHAHLQARLSGQRNHSTRTSSADSDRS